MAAFFGANEIWKTHEGDSREPVILAGVRELDAREPVSEEAFRAMHGVSLDEAFPHCMDKPIRDGLLTRENGFLRLTRRGMDVQNRVLVEFLS